MASAPTPDPVPDAITDDRVDASPADPGGTGEGQAGTAPGAADAPPPAPRSPYAKMSQRTSVRNVVWALSLTMAVVVVVAILFFGVGRDLGREIPESSRVDVTASAERAQELAPFPVAVPQVGEDWQVRDARYRAGEDPRWIIRYSAPSRGLVTMTETTAITPALVQDLVPGGRSDGTVEISGTTCDVYVGQDEDGQEGEAPQAVACAEDGAAVVVHGTVDRAELVELAGPALVAARG